MVISFWLSYQGETEIMGLSVGSYFLYGFMYVLVFLLHPPAIQTFIKDTCLDCSYDHNVLYYYSNPNIHLQRKCKYMGCFGGTYLSVLFFTQPLWGFSSSFQLHIYHVLPIKYLPFSSTFVIYIALISHPFPKSIWKNGFYVQVSSM